MKIRAEKLAALLLTGALVVSGFGQTMTVNAEETDSVTAVEVQAEEVDTDATNVEEEKTELPKEEQKEEPTAKVKVEPAATETVEATGAETAETRMEVVAKAGDTEYGSLAEAFAQAPNQSEIELVKDINEFTTADIVKIPVDKTFILNMAGHTIKASADNFTGRFIENEGTLTVTGNGTMDSSPSANGGYGAINNKGTLTIENGTYRGAIYASGSGIRNTGKNAVLTVKDGTFDGATCAIYNEGTAVLEDGVYAGETCSTCNSSVWSYTIRNVTADSKMTINGGTYTGVQGAVSASIGYLEVNGGTIKSVKCVKNPDHTATFYALYAAGENGQVKCVINDGHFETEGNHAAVVVGNDNTNGDGGINAEATAIINGGNFVAPEGVPALKGAEKTGDPQILGGKFSSDVSQYLPSGMEQDEDGNVIVNEKAAVEIGDVVYMTLADAIAAVKDGETITLLKDVTDAEGIAVESGKNFTIDFNNKEYVVAGPGEGSPNTQTNAFQLLKDSTITMKNGTIKVAENGPANNVKRIIQNYADLTLENMTIETKNLGAYEDYALSLNNGNVVFKGSTNIIMSSPDKIAFDVCKFGSGEYPNLSVTFDDSFTGTIGGKIIFDSNNAETHKLTINGNGSFAGIDASEGNEEVAKEAVKVSGGSFGESVEEYLVEDLKAELKRASGDYPYSYFTSVEEALANAAAGDEVRNLTIPEGKDAFEITLDYGYDNKVVSVNDSAITLPTPQREGYKFLGWYVGDKLYKAGDVVEVTKDTKIVAKWEKVEDPQPTPEPKPEPGEGGTPKPETKPGSDSNVPKTGDTANVAGYLMMALAAGAAIVTVVKKRRG